MNPILFTVNGVDFSQYLKGIEAEPSGPGIVGSATLHLDKQAGGLDIRFGDEVKVWQAFNSAGAGVAPNGRLFGGVVVVRDTGNIGTTKTWTLSCMTYNGLLKRLARKRAAAYTVVLSAGTFASQVAQIVDAVQRNGQTTWPPVQFDTSTGVANLVASMPAATYPGGRTLDWYFAQLCIAARAINSALWPAYFIDTQVSSGVGDVFGSPVVWFYDAALTPTPTSHFTDTPGTPVGANVIYGKFRRLTDGTDVVQMRESAWNNGNLFEIYADNISQGLYPNRFQNHGLTGNTGYWTTEALEDNESTVTLEAQARLKATVQPLAVPRDSVEFDTDYMALPGSVTGITWALESMVDTPMRVAQAIWDFSEEGQVWTRLTIGQLVLELGEDGHAILTVPVEGESKPDPPGTLTATLNTVDTNPRRREVHSIVTAPQSASPSALYYRLYNSVTTELLYDHVYPSGGTVTFDFYRPAGTGMFVTMAAVSGGGIESDWSSPLSLPSRIPTITPPGVPAIDATFNNSHGWGYDRFGANTRITWTYSSTYGDPDYFVFEYWRDGGGLATTWNLPGSSRAVYIDGLFTPDNWHFRIKAHVADWDSANAAVTQIIPVETVAPPGLFAIATNTVDAERGMARIEVTWTAAAPASWQNAIASYNIKYDRGRGVEVINVPSGTIAKFWVSFGVAFTLWMTAVSTTGAESVDVPTPHMSTTAASPSYSVLFNGSFELEDPTTGISVTNPDPYGWTISRAGGALGGLDTTRARDGRKSLKITTLASTTSIFEAASRRFPVVGSRYLNIQISAWNSTGTDAILVFNTDYYDAAGSLVGGSNWQQSIPSGAWYDYTFQLLVTPAGVTEGRVRISNSNALPVASSWWVDAISVEPAMTGTRMAPNTIPTSVLATLSPDPTGTYAQVAVNNKGQVTGGVAAPSGTVEARYRGFSTTTYTANPEPVVDTDVTGASVSFTLAAARTVIVTVYMRAEKNGGSTRIHVTDASNNILLPINAGNFQAYFSVNDAASGTNEQIVLFRGQLALAAGSWTLKCRHQASATTAAISFYDRLIDVEVLVP